jgi:IPT/TIG domain
MLLLLTAATLRAAPVTASWNTNPEPDIAGYKLLYGTASGSYSSTIDVGNVTSYVLSLSASQTYYFVVQAYNTSGLQSAYSTEASFTVPISTAPTIVTVTPSAGAIGATVTIQGSNFGATRGTSTIAFNGVAATPTSWSATSIGVPIPVGATTGNVVVTVGGVASNGAPFAVTGAGPTITSLTPSTGWVGYAMTIVGANFGATQGTSTVTFNGTAGIPTSWSANSIVIPVPAGATTGNVVVTVNGMASNGVLCTITSATPTITTLAPSSAPAGTPVTITGTNFGATKGTSTVTFNGTAATPTSWSATSIVVPAPVGAVTGNVVVTVNGVSSNSKIFTVSGGTQTIAFVQQAYATPASGTTVAVPFGAAQTAGDLNVAIVGWNDATQTVQSVTDTKGNVYVRAVGPTVLAGSATQSIYYAKNISGAAAGANTVTVTFGGSAAYPDVRIAEYSGLDSSNPVDATAAAFGTSGASDSGAATTTNANDLMVAGNLVLQGTISAGSGYTSRVITVPDSDILEDQIVTTPGTYHATAPLTGGGWIMQLVAFKAANTSNPTSPALTSLAPTSGPVGTTVTINGANFGATRGTSTITFNGTAATPTTWSASSIVVPVPAGATSGNVVVTVAGLSASGGSFTVTSAGPAVITPVQHASRDAGATKSSSLPFPAKNVAGNWIGVAVRASGVGQVFTVTDTLGNIYRPAVQLTHTADTVSIAIFYAENVRGGTNTVSVSDTILGTLRFAIVEYAGVAPANSLDVIKTAQGRSTSASSGSVTTTAAGDLVLAAITTANGTGSAAGSGFVKQESLPTSGAKLMVEDRIQAGAGAVTAAASLSSTDDWGLIVAAFKAATGTGGVSMLTLAGGDSIGGAASGSQTAQAMEQTVAVATKNDNLRATDYDGDGASDLATFTPATGNWAISLSGANHSTTLNVTLGGSSDVPVPGDYDGDGRTDVAVYRPSLSKWTILTSSSGYTTSIAYVWGQAGDVPMPGDYDGDGKTDLAVYRPSTGEWLITVSATKTTMRTVLGEIGDVPVTGQFDGDHKTDIAVFTPSNGAWTVRSSSTGYTNGMALSLGAASDVLAAGDYDGDGLTDVAVYTASTGTWSVLSSKTRYATVINAAIGGNGDVAVAGDYDSDGRTDMAVYHRATGGWTIIKSSDGLPVIFNWGTSADFAVVPR